MTDDSKQELAWARREITELRAVIERQALMLALAANAAVKDRDCDLFQFLAALDEATREVEEVAA